jgi:hypothetical protein
MVQQQNHFRPVSCKQINPQSNILLDLNANNFTTFKLIAILLYKKKCEPGTFRSGNYVLVVASDCSVKKYKIDPGGYKPVEA